MLASLLCCQGRVAEDHYVDIPGSDANNSTPNLYVEKPTTIVKDQKSESKTSLQLTTHDVNGKENDLPKKFVNVEAGEKKEEEEDTVHYKTSNNDKTCKDDVNGTRDFSSVIESIKNDDTNGSLKPASTVTGSNNNNFSRVNPDSVRDSDSGVNSSQTSRANTPEQKSLSSEKGGNQNNNSSAIRQSSQVPHITLTPEEAGEEDDDLDELFQKHKSGGGGGGGGNGNNLSARSSLRDSRESLYSVYSAAGEEDFGNIPVSGEINLHLEYDYKLRTLSIHVKQCKDLAPVDVKRNRSDPYVKTYLMPDKSRNGKRKTKIKRHTLNPTYNETLTYTLSKSELESRTLWISVWNNDRLGRNDFLGEVTIPLDYYDFDKSVPTWYALEERVADVSSTPVYKGDLFISIKYVPASMASGTLSKKKGSLKRGKDKGLKTGLGEIHVLVKEAKNLTAMRGAAGSNPFCKGYLMPDPNHSSKQKTPVLKKTTNPNWQHLLVFDGVDESQLENHGVELTIWDHETLSSNDFLGGTRLNIGTGVLKGKPIDWMDARGEELDVWQVMIERHNEWIDAQLPLRPSMGNQKK